MENKKPTYKELNGATRVGDALRWLGKQGKAFAPELLNLAGTVTGISGLNELGDAIRKDGDLSDVDKELLLVEMKYDMVEMEEVTKRLQSLFGTMTVFYFGSRGIEKVMKTFKQGK